MTTDATVGGEPAAHLNAEQERWSLNDQRDFLLRSIDDADREHAAGDMAKADHDVLVLRDQRRLAEVEAELAALGPSATDSPDEPDEPQPVSPIVADVRARRRFGPWRRVGIVAACLLIAGGAGILVNHAVNPSLPGQPTSGSITESKVKFIGEELTEAAILNNNGQALSAMQLYHRVLSQDPDDPIALAAWGWLEWNYGKAGNSSSLRAAGRQAEKKAVAVAPSYYAGHLFLGLILFNQAHDAQGAVKEFTKFLADDPPDAQLVSVASLVVPAYQQANVALPPKLANALATEAAATPSTTTPSASTTTTSTP